MSAVPTIPAFTAGQRLLASQLQQLSTAATFAQQPPMAILAQSVAQSVTSGSIVALTWPAPSFDPYAGWAAGTPTQYTPQVPGYYDIAGIAAWTANATSNRDSLIRLNGTIVSQVSLLAATAADATNIPVYAPGVYFNGTTDSMDFAVVQRSGGALLTIVALTQLSIRLVHV